ncbi:uncharacterized protein LOC123613546 isoform X1 [Camelus bactrianus]|uniref:Uncharacterized protein LOC123613546 isoform X1 n=1 Tax=Camelus bactrianus TaxID=9837 RepID=A0AC58PGQ8_CAMBA
MEKGVTEANISRTSPALIREGVIPGCTGVCGFNSPWADKNQISDCKAKPTLLLEGVSTNRVLLGGCRKHLIPSFADWGYSPLEVNHLPAQLAQDGRRKCVLEELTLGPQPPSTDVCLACLAGLGLMDERRRADRPNGSPRRKEPGPGDSHPRSCGHTAFQSPTLLTTPVTLTGGGGWKTHLPGLQDTVWSWVQRRAAPPACGSSPLLRSSSFRKTRGLANGLLKTFPGH